MSPEKTKQDVTSLFPRILHVVVMHLFVILGVLTLRGYLFPSSNHAIEIPPILAMLKPGLYASDYYVQEMLRFTPRTYYNYLVYGAARAGLGISPAYLVLFVGALTSFLLGLRAVARRMGLSRIARVLFVFWGFSVTAGMIGGSPDVVLWPSTPIPSAFAMGVVVWGVYFSLRRAWAPAYAFFGATCLLQFQVGLLPALLVSPLVLFDAWRSRRWRPALLGGILAAVGAGLVYVPMVLQGTTSSGLLTNRAFVELYAYVRHPHHIVPSAWPASAWVQLVLFYVGGALCLLRARTLQASYKAGLLIVVGGAALGLLLNVLFVEVWPLALVAKLQFARTTAFAQLGVLIGLGVLFQEHLEQRHGIVCILLGVALVSHYPGLLLILLALAMPSLERIAIDVRSKAGLALAAFLLVGLYRFPFSSPPVFWVQALLEGPLLLGVLFTPYLLHRWVPKVNVRIALAAGLIVATSGVLFIGVGGLLPGPLDALFAQKVTISGEWRDDVGRLARRFRHEPPGDALVLTPPSVQHFRLFSRKSVVVDFKAFPFTDRGLKEWRARMEAVEAYCTQSPTSLADVARRYGAAYILSRHDCHPVLPGVKVDQEGAWALWKLDGAERPPPR